MEKTTKMIAAAVVLVLCAVAVIGVGYAYTAQTVNSGNTATAEYTVIHQSGEGAYQFDSGTDKIDWNTKDYRTGAGTTESPYVYNTDFWLDDADPYTDDALHGSYMLTKVGKSFNLITEPQAGGAPTANLTCEIEAGKAEGKNGFENVTDTSALFLKIYHKNGTTESDVTYLKWDTATKSFKAYGTTGWSETAQFTIAIEEVESVYKYKEYTVDVLYGYAGDEDYRITTTHILGSAPTEGVPTAKPIDDAILTFTITV